MTTDEVIHLLKASKWMDGDKPTIEVAIHHIESLEGDVKALLDMFTDQWVQANPGKSMPPDWVTMAHAMSDAKEGKGTDIDEIVASNG